MASTVNLKCSDRAILAKRRSQKKAMRAKLQSLRAKNAKLQLCKFAVQRMQGLYVHTFFAFQMQKFANFAKKLQLCNLYGFLGVIFKNRFFIFDFFLLAGQLVHVTWSCWFIIGRWEVKICTWFLNWGEVHCASETCETFWCMIVFF